MIVGLVTLLMKKIDESSPLKILSDLESADLTATLLRNRLRTRLTPVCY